MWGLFKKLCPESAPEIALQHVGTSAQDRSTWQHGRTRDPGRDRLFGCFAVLPSMSFYKSPILCPRSHPSYTQPSNCPGQATELPNPFDSLSPPQAARLFPASASPPTPPDPSAGPLTQQGPCVGFCLCSLQTTRGGYPNHCLGTKGEGTCPVSAQQRSSVLTFSPQARPGQQPGHRVMFPEPSLYKLWSRVSRGRGVC